MENMPQLRDRRPENNSARSGVAAVKAWMNDETNPQKEGRKLESKVSLKSLESIMRSPICTENDWRH